MLNPIIAVHSQTRTRGPMMHLTQAFQIGTVVCLFMASVTCTSPSSIGSVVEIGSRLELCVRYKHE